MADVRLYQIVKLSRDAIILKSATKNSFEHIMLNIYCRTLVIAVAGHST